MRAYTVEYILYDVDKVKSISFLAKNKTDAYDKAVYEIIPEIEKESPYSAWVSSVTYSNGNYKRFNTSSGNPY